MAGPGTAAQPRQVVGPQIGATGRFAPTGQKKVLRKHLSWSAIREGWKLYEKRMLKRQ
jgi:hypothetical protein